MFTLVYASEGLITYLNLHQLPLLPPREPHLLTATSRCSALSVICKLRAGRYTCERVATSHWRETRCTWSSLRTGSSPQQRLLVFSMAAGPPASPGTLLSVHLVRKDVY